jgi:hypothetical protein
MRELAAPNREDGDDERESIIKCRTRRDTVDMPDSATYRIDISSKKAPGTAPVAGNAGVAQ